MRIAAAIFGVLALLSFAVIGAGLLLPSSWEAETSAVMDAPPDRIFPHVAGAEGWARWTPWPAEGIRAEGPETGEGSSIVWDDPELGSGRFVIRETVPGERVAYEVELGGGRTEIRGVLEMAPEGDGTNLRWREEGSFGRNPLLGFTAIRMNRVHGEQLDRALARLSALLEEEGGPGAG